MSKGDPLPLAVMVAESVLDMHYEIEALRREVERLKGYERDFHALLDSSTKHNAHMMSGLLEIAMKPGVLDAISKSNQEQSNV